MTFPVVGGNQDTSYEVSNSLNFNNESSPYLELSTGSANERLFTFSVGARRQITDARQCIWSSDNNTNDTGDGNRGGSGVELSFWNDSGGGYIQFGGFGGNFKIRSNGFANDLTAWYHIVGIVDTAQGTTNDRGQLWVNGVKQTDYQSMIGQNTDVKFATNRLGTKSDQANYGDSTALGSYFDGYISEFYLIDGSSLDATYFGEFNNEGNWIPKDYTGSYGTHGYRLEFKQTGTSQNSSGIGADTSGNDKHFTVNNLAAIDVLTDTPTNIFCTLNPATNSEIGNAPTFQEGNRKITMTNYDVETTFATMGLTRGKWYWEVKGGWKTSNWGLGINKASDMNVGFSVGYFEGGYSFSQNGYKNTKVSGSQVATQIDSGLSDGDIIGYALDLDNGHFNFSQNGTWYNGSATESTTFDTSNHDFTSLDFGDEFVVPCISGFGDGEITTEINWGQPTYTGTDQSDANGYGSFEYAPPSGYYSICTKNLAEFG